MINLTKFSHYKKVSKKWGTEYWLVNSYLPSYCAKLLVLNPGYKCSLHCHHLKTETFVVLEGVVNLRLLINDREEKLVLIEGQHFTLHPHEYHQFSSSAPAVILEVSSFHDDNDVQRLEESGPVNA